MDDKFLPRVSRKEWDDAVDRSDLALVHDLVVQPMHEALYHTGNFDFMDRLVPLQQMLLAYDYVQSQVRQGGFIQFIQNHYVSLLLPVIEGLKLLGENEMAGILDDVLKVYVLNHKELDAETSPEEFAAMYQEFKEFEALEEKFHAADESAMQAMTQYIIKHPQQFVHFTS